MTNFAEVVRSLDGDDPRGNITALKGAVREQLQATDNRVRVDLTDHFNHSFVPDLVLSWPGTKDTRQSSCAQHSARTTSGETSTFSESSAPS
jgi:hypothetical protein